MDFFTTMAPPMFYVFLEIELVDIRKKLMAGMELGQNMRQQSVTGAYDVILSVEPYVHVHFARMCCINIDSPQN